MKPHVKHGLLLGLICSVLYVADTYVGSAVAHDIFTWGSYFGIAGMIYLAVKERRELQSDSLSFGQAFTTGALVTLIGGGITAVAFYLNAKFFNRPFVENAKMETEHLLEGQGRPDKQIEMTVDMIGPGSLSLTHFVIILIVGIIATLLVAAILKKDDRNPMVSENEEPGMRA